MKERKKIPVNLKFYTDEVSGKLVSYVARKNSSWMGVRESDRQPKKVVVVGTQVQYITEGVLYCAVLIPMREKDGFVAISIKPVQFEPLMEVLYHKSGDFYIKITFGNRQMVYDPRNANPASSDINEFRKRLLKRVDIKGLNELVDDFDKVVNIHTADKAK